MSTAQLLGNIGEFVGAFAIIVALGRAFMNVTTASGPAEVNPEDAITVTAFLACGLKNAELCYIQYQNGVLD